MSGGAIFILVLLVLFLVWLMLVRPQRRRQQAQQAMIDYLKMGDEVLTAGGIFATVVGIDEDEVTVELSPGVEARVDKRAIAAVMPDEEPLEPEPQAEDPEPREEREAGAPQPIGEKPR
jgi:preprotein translocase subunit YajC